MLLSLFFPHCGVFVLILVARGGAGKWRINLLSIKKTFSFLFVSFYPLLNMDKLG